MTDPLCGKLCYTRAGAKLALKSLALTKRRKKKTREKRLYWCRKCQSWHLTSGKKK